MNLLDLLSNKKLSESIEHQINPVYDTAKDCLINLVKARCDEAILLNQVLKFYKENDSNNAVHKGTALFQELRYRFVNDAIMKSGMRNILDIGCGYSPRGILFSNMNYHYVGADLPAAIKEIEPAIRKCLDNQTNINYVQIDATNPQNLIDAANLLKGSVCIVSEGLFMYLPMYELNEYVKGLKQVLQNHGGCIITPDFSMNKLLQISLEATSNKLFGYFLQKIAEKIVKGYTVPSNNNEDSISWYTKQDDTEPYNYFSKMGFNIERIVLYNDDIELNSIGYIKSNKKIDYINNCKNIYGFKITLR